MEPFSAGSIGVYSMLVLQVHKVGLYIHSMSMLVFGLYKRFYVFTRSWLRACTIINHIKFINKALSLCRLTKFMLS